MNKKELIKLLKKDKNINTIIRYEKDITVEDYIEEQAIYYNINLTRSDIKDIRIKII